MYLNIYKFVYKHIVLPVSLYERASFECVEEKVFLFMMVFIWFEASVFEILVKLSFEKHIFSSKLSM